MKKVLLITTGGTIASKKTDKGFVPVNSNDIIFNSIKCNIKNKFLFPPDYINLFDLDSTNIMVENWQTIASTIYENIDKYDSFVISHGTDTMAYTSSALSVIFENINKPIILTGSQIPIELKYSDAYKNINDAFLLACSDIKGIFIVFNGKIILGKNAKKIYTKNIDAFDSINNDYVGYIENDVLQIDSEYKKNIKKEFIFKNKFEKNIYVHKVIPINNINFINNIINSNIKGIIFECYGMGGVPDIYRDTIKNAINNNIVIVIATQCLYDGVNLEEYKVGLEAKKLGVISSKNYTLEYTIVRLMSLLAYNEDIDYIKSNF